MAIDTKELRIGNWINTPRGIRQMSALDDDKISCYCDGAWRAIFFPKLQQDLQPLPISEEWLQKLGFEMRMINGIIPEWYIMCTPPNYKREFALRFRFGMLRDTLPGLCDEQSWAPWRDSGDAHNFNIKFIHQLQNWYYLITGEELKIKSA